MTPPRAHKPGVSSQVHIHPRGVYASSASVSHNIADAAQQLRGKKLAIQMTWPQWEARYARTVKPINPERMKSLLREYRLRTGKAKPEDLNGDYTNLSIDGGLRPVKADGTVKSQGYFVPVGRHKTDLPR